MYINSNKDYIKIVMSEATALWGRMIDPKEKRVRITHDGWLLGAIIALAPLFVKVIH